MARLIFRGKVDVSVVREDNVLLVVPGILAQGKGHVSALHWENQLAYYLSTAGNTGVAKLRALMANTELKRVGATLKYAEEQDLQVTLWTGSEPPHPRGNCQGLRGPQGFVYWSRFASQVIHVYSMLCLGCCAMFAISKLFPT